MRQFGLAQHIPYRPSQPENIHALSLRGKPDRDWVAQMTLVLAVWADRLQYEVAATRAGTDISYNDSYLVWYRSKTKMFIDPKNASIAEVVNNLF